MKLMIVCLGKNVTSIQFGKDKINPEIGERLTKYRDFTGSKCNRLELGHNFTHYENKYGMHTCRLIKLQKTGSRKKRNRIKRHIITDILVKILQPTK